MTHIHTKISFSNLFDIKFSCLFRVELIKHTNLKGKSCNSASSTYRVYKPKCHLFKFLTLANLYLTHNVARYLKWKLHLLTLSHIYIIVLWGQPQEAQKSETSGGKKFPSPWSLLKGHQLFFKHNFVVQTNLDTHRIVKSNLDEIKVHWFPHRRN